MAGLLESSESRRRRGRIAYRVFLATAMLIAIPTVFFTVVLGVSLVGKQADQDAYDRAPICPAGSTDSHDCALQTTATVVSVWAYKNSGKSAHGSTTEAYLKPRYGDSQIVTASRSHDLTYDIHDGDTWPVLVWKDEITRYVYSGKTHDTDENPHHLVAERLIGTTACLAAGSLFGRIVLRRFLRRRIAVNPARHRIPDWTLTALVPATAFAAVFRFSWAVTVLALLGVVVIIGSAAVWPFLPWVMEPDPQSLLGTRKRRRPPTRKLP